MSERTAGGSIDIVVGGQFGDEGKGQICAHLMKIRNYKFSARVGGSNAEHRFCDSQNQRFSARVLPTVAWIDPEIKLFLGAGHVIKLDRLSAEIYSLEKKWGCNQTDRIFIDPQAGVVAPAHLTSNKKTWGRGSTRQGIGNSVAHKILRDGTYKLAKDYYKLQPYIKGRVNEMIDEMLQHNEITGLLEGNQGALLSLDHGYYPFNTSKNPTPTGLLTELGIGMKWVREIYAVYRFVPMRVPGKSGHSEGRELSWAELEERLGFKIPELNKRQTDSGDYERVFEWSWEEFKYSIILISPTALVLTFRDWFVGDVLSLEQHMQKMEKIADCPIWMVRNGSEWGNYQTFY